MEIEPLGGGVSGQQNRPRRPRESGERRAALVAREPPVENDERRRRSRELLTDVQQRVAIFREHDGGFVRASKQLAECRQLRLARLRNRGGARTRGKRRQQPPLALR